MCIDAPDPHWSIWLTLCSQSLNPAIDPVWGLSTLPTTSNAALVRSSVNVASVMLVQLPGTLYLPALKILLKSHLWHIAFSHFVSAHGQFVSRALQIHFVFVFKKDRLRCFGREKCSDETYWIKMLYNDGRRWNWTEEMPNIDMLGWW